jgi:hypothetical protein
MNFTNAKIFENNRFIALHADETTTIMYVGVNDENDGVTITKTIYV